MNRWKTVSTSIHYFSFLVWFVNGFLFKIVGLIPRHETIVAHILGEKYASFFTIVIGLFEVALSIWILLKIESQKCTQLQLALILLMNLLEFALVPELLLFGRFNLVLAFLFCILLYLNEFKLKTNKSYA